MAKARKDLVDLDVIPFDRGISEREEGQARHT